MHTPDSSWQDAAKGASSGMQRMRSSQWQQALDLLRSPAVTAILGAVMVLGLLLAFGNVVAQHVAQADQIRMAREAQDAAAWRCKQLRWGGERGSCLVKMSLARDLAVPAK
ncbi:MAG: hypothetical protein V4792_09340 [Pseudomonadota bacterium]